jgi:hypothetical protein
MNENKIQRAAVADGGQATASREEAPTTTRKYLVPTFSVDHSGFYGGWSAAWATEQVLLHDVLRSVKDRPLYLLNAIVPMEGLMFVTRVDLPLVAEILKRVQNIKSFIGHEATAKLLSEISGREIAYNRGMYQPARGDVAMVARLKTRVAGDIKEIRPEDLEYLIVWYLE